MADGWQIFARICLFAHSARPALNSGHKVWRVGSINFRVSHTILFKINHPVHNKCTVPPQLERRRTITAITITRFSLIVPIEGTHYMRHYYTNLVEGGRTIQGDLLIEESALRKRGNSVWNERIFDGRREYFLIEFFQKYTFIGWPIIKIKKILNSQDVKELKRYRMSLISTWLEAFWGSKHFQYSWLVK